MDPAINYDTIIIGAGPPGTFCACELIQKKSGMKVLMVEKGCLIEKRVCPKRITGAYVGYRPCPITTDSAGASAFPDNKLSLSPGVRDNLPRVLGHDRTVELLKEPDSIHLKFSADTNVYDMDKQKEIEEIRRKAIGTNLKLIECPIRYLGTGERHKIYTRLQEYLLAQGITMEFSTMIRDIIIEGDIIGDITTDKDEIYYVSEVVSAIGREDSGWFSHICGNHGIQTQIGTADIDVRMEVRDEVMKLLNENLREAELVYYTPTFDDKVHTFCTNPSGEMATEYYEDSLAVVNGHTYRSQEYKTNNTSFVLLVSKNFTKPFNESIEYDKHAAQLSNMLCGGRIMAQTFGDFQGGRRIAKKRLCHSSLVPILKDVVPGDLFLAFPYRIMTGIKEMLLALSKMTLGAAGDGILSYSAEVEFHSSKMMVNVDFETNIRGLRAIGDGASVTRGPQQASANGISVARGIPKQMETLQYRNVWSPLT